MGSMADSIFTKIINGEIPSHKVYEDEQTFAFMDINPVQAGMVVVVPKVEIDNIEDLNPEQFSSLMLATQKVMRALRKTYPDKAKIAVQVEGLEVPHAHVKLFPINSADEFRALPANQDPDHTQLAEQSQKIRSTIDV